MRCSRSVLLVVVVLFLQSGCAVRRITRTSDGEPVDMPRMVEELKGARVVFVGETHNVEEHHQAQFEVIKGLFEAGVPLAVGLEMFSAASQRDLDRWVAGRLDEGSFIRIFQGNWRQKWVLYRDIFLYARDNHIPLIGLNIPKGVMHTVYTRGFAALNEQERKGLPSEVTCDAGDPYTGVIQRLYAGHGRDAGPFGFFCEAQTLWNRGMALNLSNYLDGHPGVTMVVMAGGGHVMKQGMPAQMKRYGDYPCRVVLPDIHGLFAIGVTSRDADYFIGE
ncbi:MAG TPA: ChaN family lipoprotein [Geobacteraceae bacterium]